MAKGTSDVELTIRARNEASKAISSVASALSDLKSAQSGVADEARKTDSTLDQLGNAMSALSKQVGGLTAYDRVVNSLQRTSQAVAAVEEKIETLREKQSGLAAELAKTEQAMASLSSESQKLSDTLARQDDESKKAVAELRKLDAEIKKTTTGYNKAERDTNRYQNQLQKMENRLARTQAKHRELTQELLRTEEPSERLIANFEKTDAALREQEAAVTKLQSKYAESRASVSQLGASLKQLQSDQQKAASASERAAAAQSETAAKLKETKAAIDEASRSQKRLQRDAASTAAQLEKQGAALESGRQDLKLMEQAAAEAGAALDRVGQTIRGRLLKELATAKKELASYRDEWQRTTRVVQDMVRAGGSVKNPTPELAQAILDARQAKAAYQQMQQAIHVMRGSIRAAGTDVNALTRANQTFVTTLARVTSAANATSTSLNKVRTGARGTSEALNEVSRGARNSSSALDLFSNRTRSAMSWAQRLRGELITLTMSYVGLYGAIQQLGGVTDAFMQVEAAQNRMLAAFDGSEAFAAREMRWIRQEADRLGIQFGILAQEYSKFAIATRGTALAGDETRRIFLAVAEAARVNKLSVDQMEGTFLALSQMVSKGVVSMEELRRQMGDRLYGAFTLAAEAMGISTKELDKLISTGQLASEDLLPKFADRLQEVFSPQLSKSLDTFTADLGKFQNEILKAQLTVANAGFIEGLREAIVSLTEYFRSDEGVAFLTNLGRAAGALVKVLAEVPKYIQEITFVFSLLVGVRVAQWLSTLGTRFQAAVTAARASAAATKAATAETALMAKQVQATTPLMTRLSTAVTTATARVQGLAKGMTAARAGSLALAGGMGVLRGAMAFLGGVPGLIITGLSFAFSMWIGRTDEATTALQRHEQHLVSVIDAYSRAAGKAGEWAREVKSVSLADAEGALRGLADQLNKDIGKALDGVVRPMRDSMMLFGDINFDESEQELMRLGEQLRKGQITVKEFSETLDGMLKSPNVPNRVKVLIRENGNLVASAVEAEERLAKQGVVVQELGGDASLAARQIEALGLSIQSLAREAGLDEVGGEKAVDNTARLNELIDQLRRKVPSMADEMKLDEALGEIDDILKTAEAIEGIDKTSEAFKRLMEVARQAKTELQLAFDAKQFSGLQQLLSSASGSVETSAALLRQFEGFRSKPYWDVNAYRAGFGSDTITLSDGTIKKVTDGMSVSITDANRDLLRRVGEFQATIRSQIGDARFEAFSDQQQAVLTSIAYNYGSLPEKLVEAIREGSTTGIAQAIRGLGKDNAGVNQNRRNQEAFLFASSDDPYARQRRNEEALKTGLKLEEDLEKKRERAIQQQEQFHERLNETLQLRSSELAMGEKRTMQQEVDLALMKAESDARRAGTELTKEQRELIRQNTEIEWQRANATREQEEAEKRINLLMQTRRDILQQMEMALNSGDLQTYDALNTQLETLDTKLKSLIQDAIRMWQALGSGEQVEAAIANLQVMLNTLETVNQKVKLMASDFGRAFGDELITGADNFLAKIRETGDVVGAAKEAFRQFASDFLLRIAQMIMKQALFNALSSVFGNSPAGSFGAGVMAAFKAHVGGVVGAGLQQVSAHGGLFANAVRYHSGGIAGLAPNEVPAILEKGEEVLTANDPRHIRNGGGAQGETSVKIVNAIDAGSFVSAGVEDVQGQKAILNFIRANRGSVRGALGV